MQQEQRADLSCVFFHTAEGNSASFSRPRRRLPSDFKELYAKVILTRLAGGVILIAVRIIDN